MTVNPEVIHSGEKRALHASSSAAHGAADQGRNTKVLPKLLTSG
jgi:hypothetical protein